LYLQRGHDVSSLIPIDLFFAITVYLPLTLTASAAILAVLLLDLSGFSRG